MLKNPFFWLALAALAVVAIFLWKKSKTTAATTKAAPVHAAAPVSSTASELQSVASLAKSATSIFQTLYNGDSED